MDNGQESPQHVQLIYCYTDVEQDKVLQRQLRKHFFWIRDQPLFSDWDYDDIAPGDKMEEAIYVHIDTAHIILVLMSANFVDFDLFLSIKDRVLGRHKKKEVKVFLILLRSIAIFDDLFPGIEWLPVKDEHVMLWGDEKEELYGQISRRIKKEMYATLTWGVPSDVVEQKYQDCCPYRGLKPYTEQDAPFFFGRKTFTLDLLHKLREDKRLLLILGPTGSGKTSIIQAGIVPLLREGKAIPRSFTWEIIPFTPAQDPTSQLLSLLDVSAETNNLVAGIKLWRQRHPKKERLVLILDPFEELFKLTTPQAQKEFIQGCRSLILYDLATLIIGMNDVYYGDLAQFTDFIEVAEPHIRNIPALKQEDIQEIVQKPADVARLRFEDHLAERIVEDTMKSTREPERRHRHSSILPLVSVCLEQLYEMQNDHYVTIEEYLSLGAVSGSLTTFANNAFDALDHSQQILARRILIDLVSPGDERGGRPASRRRRFLQELSTGENERKDVREIVEKLAQAHLLEVQWDEHYKDFGVSLLHESLIREWELLKDWLRDDRLFLLWHHEFEPQLQRWLNSHSFVEKRDPSSLLRGVMLLEAEAWIEKHSQRFTPEALAFVAASSILQKQEEEQQRALQELKLQQKIIGAKQVGMRALLLQAQDPRSLRKSLLLSIEALRRYHSVEADQAVRYALAHLPRFLGQINMDRVRMLLFSEDGSMLVGAGMRGVSWISHIASNEESSGTLFLGETTALALSAHGDYLFVGTYSGVAWLIHTHTQLRVGLIKYIAHIQAVALTKQEPYIAIIAYADGIIRAFRFLERHHPTTLFSETGLIENMIFLYECSHHSPVTALSFSYNEHYFVSAGTDQVLRVWSRGDGLCLNSYTFQHPLSSVLWSPDDTLLAVRCEDGSAYLWSWSQKSPIFWPRKQEHIVSLAQKEKIKTLAFSPDGACITTSSDDGRVRICNLKEMTHVLSFQHPYSVAALAYHNIQDLLMVAGENGHVGVYSLSDGTVRQYIPHDLPARFAVFSSQKLYLATLDSHDHIYIWQIHDGALPASFSYSGKMLYLVFDQVGEEHFLRFVVQEVGNLKLYTLFVGLSPIDTPNEFQHAPCWIAARRSKTFPIVDTAKILRAFSLDGRYIAEATHNGYVYILGTESGQRLISCCVSGTISALEFSRDGSYLAITTADGPLFLWKWGEQILLPMPLSQHTSVQSAIFTYDGEYLVAVANKKEIFLWHWKTQTETLKPFVRQESDIDRISPCPNTQYLLTISKQEGLKIWDLKTGIVVQHLLCRGNILFAAFDHEGKYIALVCADHTVGIWDVFVGEQRASLPHMDRVSVVAFSKDGRHLATVCDDALIRVWAWKREDLEKEAKVRLIRNLTADEWQEYFGDEEYKEIFPDLAWREDSFRL